MQSEKRARTRIDLEAWDKLRAGEIEGLNYFFDRLAKKLIRYGLNRCEKERCKDCLQETFMSLWEHRESLGNTDSPANYIFAAYRRKLFAKGKVVALTGYTDDMSRFELPVSTQSNSPELPDVKNHLEKLSDNQKEIIYLKYYQGMDYDEIAMIMDMNYQSARNLMNRAIKSLRSMMATFML